MANMTTGGLCVCAAMLAGCGQGDRPEPIGAKLPNQSVAGRASERLAGASGGVVAGYVHNFANSKFAIGSTPQSVQSSDRLRLVGSNGVFSTHANGAILAIPNATAPFEPGGPDFAPWTGGAAAHNARVTQYFAAAGLPQDQTGEAAVSSGVSGGGFGAVQPSQMFTGYNTSITRRVQGFLVVESMAHASFDANGVVTSEGVYWPQLSQSVVSDAAAIAAIIADPVAGPAYWEWLPS